MVIALNCSAVTSYVIRNAAPKSSFTPVTVTRTLTLAPLDEPASSAIVPGKGAGVSGVNRAGVGGGAAPPRYAGSAEEAVARRTAAARGVIVRCGIIGVSGKPR